ncbi:TlpA disulfide reductase family protein [uncultured Nonlabens sp.]|uniref:TlpA disulfide reductase family protein n=1 Tax=uncultured Nonlabens sp. TaxID=859306 RepID=UPI0026083D92|nr:TlpA disulfide reductase family protein [uncultured Nonlabens sp.]
MKYALILFTFLAVNQCNKKVEETHLINGTAPGVANGMRVYMNALDENGSSIPVDTNIVMNEKFFFKKKEDLETEQIRFLTIDGSKGNIVILIKNENIQVNIKKDSLFASKIIGTASNKALQDFKSKQASYTVKARSFNKQRSTARRSQDVESMTIVNNKWMAAELDFKSYSTNLITTNNKSIVAPIILGELLKSKLINAEDARKFYNTFDPSIQNSLMATRIDVFLRKEESVAIGAKAPDFEGVNPEGKVIKLNEVLGKVTLIDFWASWCGPCRRENPNVVAAYNKYHKKGFNIISVSLDRKGGHKAWKAAIIKDKMDWNHVSRLQYFGPIAQLYNVNAIPSTFLLDKNGVIIATNLRGQQLQDKLEELLN